MMIERDFAATVDDFMIARDLKLERERPLGILERTEIPVISNLLRSIKNAPPQLASVIIDLYDLSYLSLENLSRQVLLLRGEVAGGKEFKALSILTESGGLTYLVCRRLNEKIMPAAEAIGAKHKYDSKRDRWYVVVDSIETELPVDALLPILGKWEEDEDLAEISRRVATLFGSSREGNTIGETSSRASAPKAAGIGDGEL